MRCDLLGFFNDHISGLGRRREQAVLPYVKFPHPIVPKGSHLGSLPHSIYSQLNLYTHRATLFQPSPCLRLVLTREGSACVFTLDLETALHTFF